MTFIYDAKGALWEAKRSVEVIDLGKDTFLYKCSLPDDFEKVLFGGPWYILAHYINLSSMATKLQTLL